MTHQEQQSTVVGATTAAATPQRDPAAKEPFVPPKLTFITPKLTKQGHIETVTGIAGTFFSTPS